MDTKLLNREADEKEFLFSFFLSSSIDHVTLLLISQRLLVEVGVISKSKTCHFHWSLPERGQ